MWYESDAITAAQILGGLMVAGFLAHISFPRGSRVSQIARVAMVVFFVAAIVAGGIGVTCECDGG
jgi:hypothetical protein